jgi:selenocysteine-specific elongation factor
MTRRLVLGTAGHIDHGKTSLVKLLTGYDCDRLPEEKARGITIELGFTKIDLPSGLILGVVDVPGHERFVRNMVAGAAGIDLVMLVVAADEGVMPQTREHLAICRLLGIRHGLVALTKTDMVDDALRELAEDDVAELVEGTFLEDAPVVPISAVTGEGKDAIIAALDRVASETTAKSDSGIFRLPIDRVFTMKGFGTVVTGTCIGGRIAVGDEVEILPDGRRAKVRGLQVHGRAANEAFAGERTAINLQNVEIEAAPRGAVLATPGALSPSWMLDVDAELVAEAPRALKRRSLVRLHSFTREVIARVVPMTAETLEPGESGKMQLRLTEPVVALPGDRFVLRTYSPVTTLGGGAVLNSQPRKHRAPFRHALEDLTVLAEGALPEKMTVHYRAAGRGGVELGRLAPLLGVGGKELKTHYQKLLSQRALVRVDADSDRAVNAEAFAELRGGLLTFLRRHHKEKPHEPGLSRAALLSANHKGATQLVLEKALGSLLAEEAIVAEGGIVRVPDHTVTADEDLQNAVDAIVACAKKTGLEAPTRKELLAAVAKPALAEKALGMVLRDGRMVRLGGELFFDARSLAEAERRLVAYLEQNESVDAQGMKSLFGLSRKWAIPLAEHFDAQRVTLRVGDKRVLRKRAGG